MNWIEEKKNRWGHSWFFKLVYSNCSVDLNKRQKPTSVFYFLFLSDEFNSLTAWLPKKLKEYFNKIKACCSPPFKLQSFKGWSNIRHSKASFTFKRTVVMQVLLTAAVLQIKGAPSHHPANDRYYSPPPPPGPKEDRSWSPRVDSYDLMVGGH